MLILVPKKNFKSLLDVKACCKLLEKAGASFRGMNGLGFVYDADLSAEELSALDCIEWS